MKNMITQYNEAKYEILSIVEDMGEAKSSDIAEMTNKRYENASVLMLTYHRHGLLARRRLGRAYAYSLTERGIERLDWLRSIES